MEKSTILGTNLKTKQEIRHDWFKNNTEPHSVQPHLSIVASSLKTYKFFLENLIEQVLAQPNTEVIVYDMQLKNQEPTSFTSDQEVFFKEMIIDLLHPKREWDGIQRFVLFPFSFGSPAFDAYYHILAEGERKGMVAISPTRFPMRTPKSRVDGFVIMRTTELILLNKHLGIYQGQMFRLKRP